MLQEKTNKQSNSYKVCFTKPIEYPSTISTGSTPTTKEGKQTERLIQSIIVRITDIDERKPSWELGTMTIMPT